MKHKKEEKTQQVKINKKKDYQALAEEYLAGWKSALADLDNYRKRVAGEKEIFLKLAKADLISQVLPVADNFNEAIKHIPQESLTEPWVVGVTYINKQLVDVLKQNGVEEIEIKIGDEFDPYLMEAVETDQKETKSNKVKKIITKGYNLNGRLVRPAKVGVG